MTRYYIDLKEYGENANIKDVCSDTLKEVVKDFNIELEKRESIPIDLRKELLRYHEYLQDNLSMNLDKIWVSEFLKRM